MAGTHILRHPHHRQRKDIINLNPLISFIKSNAVMTVALIAAAVTCVIVPIDEKYASYFDFKTLTCLFCVLAVVCALKNIRFFYTLATAIVKRFGTARSSVLVLIYVTFIGSMLIANDMALLTFLPLGYFVLTTAKKEKYMAFTFIMQNIAANLGGMLTPFGNPQNLYLYTKYQIPTMEFMGIMVIPFTLSVFLITLCCLIFVKAEPIEIEDNITRLPVMKTAVYLLLFAYSIAIVFRGVPYWTGLIIIPLAIYFMDKSALKKVDYPLLLTFVFFFIFSGNMARIDAVRELFSSLLEKSTLVFSTVSCQFISNVPTATLLSQFTENYKELLLGVNIGGAGTLIASLASLITYREYVSHNPQKQGYYLKLFTAFNFGFLLILIFACLIIV